MHSICTRSQKLQHHKAHPWLSRVEDHILWIHLQLDMCHCLLRHKTLTVLEKPADFKSHQVMWGIHYNHE